MLVIDHFSQGWLTPVAGYIMSCIGSLLGLRCAARAEGTRIGWLLAAAGAIGGTGIWVMHFIAMLGFAVDGASIRYDVPLTLLSAALAVMVVFIGLYVVNRMHPPVIALPLGGTITGLGVAGMHYAGMYAMKSDAVFVYDLATVSVSIVIAVVAATAALWFARYVRSGFATACAALVMGAAVCGMHYTGMYAIHAEHSGHAHIPAGASAMELLTPLIVGVSLVTGLVLLQVGMTELGESTTVPIAASRTNRYWPTAARDIDSAPKNLAGQRNVRSAPEHHSTHPREQ
ncbi:MHYT domain-containing protein [Nocardia sp. NPDC127579]|uniref:MHYT domain-containing protein n=1 Tax=Nocardia sp. NPDC127579 TaxID=3345402 RepID=UPI003635CC6F